MDKYLELEYDKKHHQWYVRIDYEPIVDEYVLFEMVYDGECQKEIRGMLLREEGRKIINDKMNELLLHRINNPNDRSNGPHPFFLSKDIVNSINTDYKRRIKLDEINDDGIDPDWMDKV